MCVTRQMDNWWNKGSEQVVCLKTNPFTLFTCPPYLILRVTCALFLFPSSRLPLLPHPPPLLHSTSSPLSTKPIPVRPEPNQFALRHQSPALDHSPPLKTRPSSRRSGRSDTHPRYTQLHPAIMNLERLLSSDTSSPLSKVIPKAFHHNHHHNHHNRTPSLSSVVSVDQVSTLPTEANPLGRVAPRPSLPLTHTLARPVVRSSPPRPHRPPCRRIPQKAPWRRQVAHLFLPVMRAPQHKCRPNRQLSLQWRRQQGQEKGRRLCPHRPIPVSVCYRVPCQGLSITVKIIRPVVHRS